MRRVHFVSLLGVLSLTLSAFADEKAGSERLVVCGSDEVYVIDVRETLAQGETKKLWSWKAATDDSLPAELRGRFGTTDECKPVDRGNLILIASSGGACAAVEPKTGKSLWYATAPNAHSIEWLPGSRIVVAASTAPGGNRLSLYDYGKSDEPLWQDALPSAHGVAWDNDRKCLWALGFDELRRYEQVDWRSRKPSLRLVETKKLPDEGGHDLQAVHGSADLVLSTHAGVWRFDREKGEFRPDDMLGQLPHVKCVSHHPTNGRVAVVQASDDAWWTDTIQFAAPEGKKVLPGERIYKVRWLVEEESKAPPPERPSLDPARSRATIR